MLNEASSGGGLLGFGLFGAATAAVAAGWSHVKNIFNYISTFVMVEAHYQHLGSTAVRRYMKGGTKYRRMPGGKNIYSTVYYSGLEKKLKDGRVPFRHKLVQTNIMFGPMGVVFLSCSSGSMTARGIRGLFNPDKLLIDALEWTQADRGCLEQNRFFIRDYVGDEKGAYAAGASPKLKSRRNESGSDSAEMASDDSSNGLDMDLDHSIRYTRDQITISKDDNPFDSLFYSPEVMQHVDDARTWLRQSNWYKQRGIPWRRGIGWEGPAGTGKSSIVRATAETLGIPLYIYHLATISDQEFIDFWGRMETPCVALFEDIDTVFDKREPLTPHKALTFECLLNTISGVQTLSGTLLMITTNHLDKVDHALLRPGRIDAMVRVGTMEEPARRQLAAKVLKDWPHMIDKMVADGEGMTPVIFQEKCIKFALNELARNKGLPTDLSEATEPSLVKGWSEPAKEPLWTASSIAEEAKVPNPYDY